MQNIIVSLLLLSGSLFSANTIALCIDDARFTPLKPNSIYVDHDDGTVSDIETGLMWQKCPLGLSGANCEDGDYESFSWQAALAAANDNTFAGYDDWRVPNKNELNSLFDPACGFPAININLFPVTSNFSLSNELYWSSSPAAGLVNNDKAWRANLVEGGLSMRVKTGSHSVRLVRGN